MHANDKDEADRHSQSSLSTSCADEMSEKELSSSEDEDEEAGNKINEEELKILG